jgi:hypothetical protein
VFQCLICPMSGLHQPPSDMHKHDFQCTVNCKGLTTFMLGRVRRTELSRCSLRGPRNEHFNSVQEILVSAIKIYDDDSKKRETSFTIQNQFKIAI